MVAVRQGDTLVVSHEGNPPPRIPLLSQPFNRLGWALFPVVLADLAAAQAPGGAAERLQV
jgi:hypothetical protein